MKEDPEVACGAWWFALKRCRFIDACEVHDRFYTSNSWIQRQGWTRKQVDDWFLMQMKMLAKNPLHKAQAYLFYGIVRVVGGFFWEGKS